MSSWTFTDDPADPCPYCVSWVDPLNPTDDPDGDHCDLDDFIPYAPVHGELISIDRVYRNAHTTCQAQVDAYFEQREHDGLDAAWFG